MAAVAAAGTVLSAYSQYSAAQIEADAGDQKAFIKRLQAQESLDAAQRDAEITIERGKLVQSSQLSSYGRSGVDVEGSPLLKMTETLSSARKDAEAQLRAGKYRAFTSNYEADLQGYLSGETRKAGSINTFSTLLTGGGNFAKAKGAL